MTNLTELWKKGELEQGEYWCEITESPYVERVYLPCCDDIIVEVLAPVPSWEQWQQMKAFCEEFNALDVAEENQQLKELLKDCNECIRLQPYGYSIEMIDKLLTKIDEVLK